MPIIIHLFGKAFNSQNCRENANYCPFVWKSFQFGKIVGQNAISLFVCEKSSIGKLKGKMPSPHKLYPCDTLLEILSKLYRVVYVCMYSIVESNHGRLLF
jgi:hypothetical protein